MTTKNILHDEFISPVWKNMFDADCAYLVDNYTSTNPIEILTQTRTFKKAIQTIGKTMIRNDIRKYAITPVALAKANNTFSAYVVVSFIENESIGTYTIELNTTLRK